MLVFSALIYIHQKAVQSVISSFSGTRYLILDVLNIQSTLNFLTLPSKQLSTVKDSNEKLNHVIWVNGWTNKHGKIIHSPVAKQDLSLQLPRSTSIYCQVMYLLRIVLLEYSDFRITGAESETGNSPRFRISMVNLFYHLISHRSAKAPINHATEAWECEHSYAAQIWQPCREVEIKIPVSSNLEATAQKLQSPGLCQKTLN